MCVYSMVHDFYDQKFPFTQTWIPDQQVQIQSLPEQDLKKLLADFAKASKAAQEVDELTNQKDCVDPEKAKLEERVKELTELLNTKTEFVILKHHNMEPGKYRILDGKIYKVIE